MGRNSTHAHERRELRLHSSKLRACPISRLIEQERAGAFRLPRSLARHGVTLVPVAFKFSLEWGKIETAVDLNTTWAADANQAETSRSSSTTRSSARNYFITSRRAAP